MFASAGSVFVKPGSERSSERMAPSKSISTIWPGGAVSVAVSRYDFQGLAARMWGVSERYLLFFDFDGEQDCDAVQHVIRWILRIGNEVFGVGDFLRTDIGKGFQFVLQSRADGERSFIHRGRGAWPGSGLAWSHFRNA